ncbi:hypothetical protein BZL39_F05970 [Zygosaccharomyces parabailii]|nr:hypothetical protein BZL39_F05970 [Zygosaccharomyces parabailii]
MKCRIEKRNTAYGNKTAEAETNALRELEEGSALKGDEMEKTNKPRGTPNASPCVVRSLHRCLRASFAAPFLLTSLFLCCSAFPVPRASSSQHSIHSLPPALPAARSPASGSLAPPLINAAQNKCDEVQRVTFPPPLHCPAPSFLSSSSSSSSHFFFFFLIKVEDQEI